uniref:Reverse transcriptase domain-containing protein n=1 Tax=Sander lucioperca TaxID=283035 RepID=A0A8C9X2A1_SANLU
EDQASLDAPITNVEISQAISSMQSGRAPGPDGFPVEFYRLFSHKLVPILNSLFKEIISTGKLPTTMTQATISVLLKKDKDPLDCGSYRPISLLCCDYKILTKVLLARRL